MPVLTFRDKHYPPSEFYEAQDGYTVSSHLLTVGSFWGEPLDCRTETNTLICVAIVAVNVSITLYCNGTNGRWPPFTGPFVTDTPEYLDFTIPPEYLDPFGNVESTTLEPWRLGCKTCGEYGSLHSKQETNRNDYEYKAIVITLIFINIFAIVACVCCLRKSNRQIVI